VYVSTHVALTLRNTNACAIAWLIDFLNCIQMSGNCL